MPCGISFSLSGPFSTTARDKLKLIPRGSPRLRHYAEVAIRIDNSRSVRYSTFGELNSSTVE